MKNILFIGGSGYIGRNLIETFIKTNKNDNFFVISRRGTRINGVASYTCELSDYNYIDEIITSKKITTVIHLVSGLVPCSVFSEYENELENVVIPTFNIIKMCRDKHVDFIYFSSGGAVYGNVNGNEPVNEERETFPISYYGLSKKIIEDEILFESNNGLKYLIIRPSNPYGNEITFNGRQGLINACYDCAKRRVPLTVFGGGINIRDYIHIDDLTKSVVLLVNNGIINETVNIGSGVGYSVNDVVNTFQKVTNNRLNIIYKNERPSDVRSIVLDNSKLKSLINIEFVNLSDGLTKQ